MSVGFSILAHRDLARVAKLAATLAKSAGPVVLHVDAATPQVEFDRLRATLSAQAPGCADRP